jgi:excinuclease ABC subunit B
MRTAIAETERRRQKQLDHNRRHGITPTTIRKAIREGIEAVRQADEFAAKQTGRSPEEYEHLTGIAELEEEMLVCAQNLQFERAAVLRDQIRTLRQQTTDIRLQTSGTGPKTQDAPPHGQRRGADPPSASREGAERLKAIRYGKKSSRH